MSLFLDKDQPILWVVLISVFGWAFNNYVDSLRLDTTLYVSHNTSIESDCRVDTFTFENLSSKNGIADLNVAITADGTKLRPCGENWFIAECLAFQPNTEVATPEVVSLTVAFPLVYPERSCAIRLSIVKDSPTLKFYMLEGRPSTAASTTTNMEQTTHISPDRMRVVTEESVDVWLIRNARSIYFKLAIIVFAFILCWIFISLVRTVFGWFRRPTLEQS